MVTAGDMTPDNSLIYAVGTKGRDYFVRNGYEIAADYSDAVNEPLYSDAQQIGEDVLEAFLQGRIGEIYLAYTEFKNTVVHDAHMVKLLPISRDDVQAEPAGKDDLYVSYEPEEEEALDIIIPKYINSLIYGALMEAVASENGARMTAMDNATSNAEDIISDLSLKYNRARQGSITQELTEIVAGDNAIS